MAEIGGKQLSTLLETLPGIASVLRSPVADALVGMIRAGAGLAEFRESDALELVQYATRRGLMGMDEGDRLVEEVKGRAKHSVPTKAPRLARAKGAPKAPKVDKKAKTVTKPVKKASAKASAGKPARKKSARKTGSKK
jgi:hypothetical protein